MSEQSVTISQVTGIGERRRPFLQGGEDVNVINSSEHKDPAE